MRLFHLPISWLCVSALMLVWPSSVCVVQSEPAQPGQAVKSSDPVAVVLNKMHFRLIGPSAPSGRVWNVVGVPSQPKTFYVCTAQGGVFRTTNNGTTMQAIFDEENAASCGAVAVAPSNPDCIWVGSGEPAARQSNGLGYGVYKSTDGAKTWQLVGLERTEQIAAIVIHPRDPQTVWVGAMGHLWGRNAERGVFRTTDGGKTWQKVLYVDDMTGCVDVAIDPRDPNVLYASMWQRLRSGGAEMRESGPGSGIYKSADAGKTWTRLTRGLPAEPLSKITLAVAQKKPDLVYAYILSGEPQRGGRTSAAGGIFRSEDGGANWQRVSSKLPSRTYYTHIRVDPKNDNRLWILDLELWRSDDGGRNWVRHNMKNVHDDLHGLWIDPNDSDHLVLGGDAGVDVSNDGGESWYQTVLPLGQFYEVDVDNQEPFWVYGGMQDTASWSGPSRTYDNEGITDHDWIKLRSVGDGMSIHPDPRDPNIILLAQNNGNLSRLDLRTWTRTELQPTQDEAKELGLKPLRWDWTPPFFLSSVDPDLFYLGAQYVFECRITGPLRDGGVGRTCRGISPDLTAQQDKPFPPVGEGYHSYGALFSLAQSPVDPNVIWAGADDGPIHLTTDGGLRWTRADSALPPGTYREGFVSKIEPSHASAGTAYVAFDLHYHDDPHPYLFKTTDYGKTWTNITNDMPAWGSTYVIREDPHNPRVLYVGTEGGLFVSIDGGAHWIRWKGDLPHTAVRSLVVHPRDKELVVGTFGRSIWIVDVSVVEQLERAMTQTVHLFEVMPAVAHNIRYTYGTGVEEINGDLFFRGENPPYGATISYYLRERAPGGAKVTIMDAAGRVVRTLSGAAEAGLNRAQWDLETDAAREALQTPAQFRGFGRAVTLSERQRARRTAPGAYIVNLETAGRTLTRTVAVRAERDGIRTVVVRK